MGTRSDRRIARIERNSKSAEAAVRKSCGHTLPEVLVVLLIVAIMATASTLAWTQYLSRAATMQAARVVQHSLYKARMLAVYRGLNHFVVFDTQRKALFIHQDSSEPFGQLDGDDPVVASESWPEQVHIGFPNSTFSMPNPLGGSALSEPWGMPLPSGAAWSGGLRGVVALPSGAIASAEPTPMAIRSGVIVFTDDRGHTTSVGIRGLFGVVHWFRFEDTGWKVG